MPPAERSDFHSDNGSVVYRIDAAKCNSNPYPIIKSLRSDSNPVYCNWGFIFGHPRGSRRREGAC